MIKKISKYFEFDRLKTNFSTEILAGLSTFLSLAYIFVVNPAILSEGGINKSAALFATVIVSSFATIVMGLWAKKPFVLAPGLEMNSYVVYFLILGIGASWQAGLGAVFWSGVLFLILTVTKVRGKIIEAIPESLKIGLAASVGMFLIIIALRLSDILVYEEIAIKSIGTLFSKKTLILLTGLTMTIVLRKLKVRGFILVSIMTSTILAHLIGLYDPNQSKVELNAEMFSVVGALDVKMILNSKMLSAIIILFVVDFYGSIAKFIGLTQNTSILDEKGRLPNQKEALMVDGGATVIGSILGTTSITTFVESATGIGEGGRSGFVAVVCGVLMLLFIPLAPLVNLVPVIATTGALLWVGITLFPKPGQLKKITKVETVAILLMILVVAVTFALDKAMLIGFGFYLVGFFVTGQSKKANLYLIASTLLILLSILLSIYV